MIILIVFIMIFMVIALPILGFYNLFCDIKEFAEGDLVVNSIVFFILSFMQTIACIFMISMGSKLIIELLEVI